MTEVLLVSIAMKLFLGGAAVFGMMFALRLFDRWAGIAFKKSFDTIEQNANALALYFGLRLVAVAIITAGALL